ncbi:hypothetical protein EDB81DRAFT_818724 [Dactylonectria macrodidyma]|uniref:CorA-like transporter domain-containing protein n=1 Tax=Dactylonectria macrodidyma TaxID=307937 RepID=A0A9P9IE79_9HYPO|nr:hypothetical protein EDB81DRAFT_818724 [Dactylonectria macrodidyma]
MSYGQSRMMSLKNCLLTESFSQVRWSESMEFNIFSWSHLSITEPAFRKLLAGLKIFTPFLRVVHAFGKKTNDKQRARDSAYHRVQTPSAYEFCYNIRYFELNGRGRGNPWSLRQTGVYQRCLSNQQSAWLLLTYSSYIVDRLSAALGEESSSTCEPCEASSLLLHFFILSAATRSWGQYIEDMRRRVMLFEEKAYSSRVDKIYLDDYELLFSDIQKMVSLGGTLAITRTVITGQRDTISKCGDLHAELHKRGPRRCGCDTANALGLLKADLHHYNGAIVDLTQATTKITQLLSAILATRANDKSQITIATIETGIAGLQLQSRQTSQDTASSLQITTQGHKDAIIIKTLAQIATMFLPASLIASLFSSTIFGSSSNRTSAVILYFAITLPLLLVTLLFLIFLEKGWSVGRWFRQFL